MRRVSISHCEFRRGYSQPSCFIDDVPVANRVLGWLRGPGPAMATSDTAPVALAHGTAQESRHGSDQGGSYLVPQGNGGAGRWNRMR